MLSYDKPVSLNGQAPIANGIAATTHSLQASQLSSFSSSQPAGISNTNSNNHSNNHTMPHSNKATSGEAMASAPAPASSPAGTRHIWLVTGPAGCGKTTVARHLAKTLNFPYIEGDEFHPPANIEKMSRGIPLTDADRWDWLTALREESVRQLANNSDKNNAGVVLTCSALKRKYRDVIRVAPYFAPGTCLHFIYLHAPEEVLLQRVSARQGHYMGASMVRSQFEILEPPTEEERDVINIDVARPVEEVEEDVVKRVGEIMGQD